LATACSALASEARWIVTPASDQFAFCCALLEALQGAPPFVGRNHVEIGMAKRQGRILRAKAPLLPTWLRNVVERALILSRGSVLRVEDTLAPTRHGQRGGEGVPPAESLRDTERAHIVQILERCQWTIEGRGQAAERLSLHPSTLRNRMRKLGIRRPPS